MGYINFDLTNTGSLHTLASPGAGMAGNIPLGMPATGGLYMILNQANNNRYIGKSGDLADRFNGRMLTINEFGLAPANLNQIGAFWGTVTPHSTPIPAFGGVVPAANAVIPPVAPAAFGFQILRNAGGAAPLMPAVLVGAAGGGINYGGAQVTTMIDGVTVNVEALLIRFVRQALGAGGTLTNLVYIGPFTNPTANELIVQVQWGACGVVGVPAAHYCISIPAHGLF